MRDLGWPIEVGVIVGVVIVLDLIVQFGLKALSRRSRGTVAPICLQKLSLPLRVVIWILGASFVADVFLAVPLSNFRHLVIVAGAFWYVIRAKRGIEARVRERMHKGEVSLDEGQLQVIGKLVSAVTVVIAAIVAMQVVGVSVEALIAVGGFGTLAVGLAGKDIFANFFSGFMLYFTRPFRVGEKITAGKAEGTVERIGWYLTTLRGEDGEPRYVPNSVFAGSMVVNHSRT